VKNAHDSQNSKSSNGDKKMTTEPEKTRSISSNPMTNQTKTQDNKQNYLALTTGVDLWVLR